MKQERKRIKLLLTCLNKSSQIILGVPVASQSDWDSESELLSASKNDEIASVQQANAVSNDVACCCSTRVSICP